MTIDNTVQDMATKKQKLLWNIHDADGSLESQVGKHLKNYKTLVDPDNKTNEMERFGLAHARHYTKFADRVENIKSQFDIHKGKTIENDEALNAILGEYILGLIDELNPEANVYKTFHDMIKNGTLTENQEIQSFILQQAETHLKLGNRELSPIIGRLRENNSTFSSIFKSLKDHVEDAGEDGLYEARVGHYWEANISHREDAQKPGKNLLAKYAEIHSRDIGTKYRVEHRGRFENQFVGPQAQQSYRLLLEEQPIKDKKARERMGIAYAEGEKGPKLLTKKKHSSGVSHGQQHNYQRRNAA